MRHSRLVFVFLACLFGSWTPSLLAQERITLTAPETVPSNLRYRLDQFSVKEDDPDTPVDESTLTIQLIGVERKVAVTCTYTANTSPTATFLWNALQKANLSSTYNNNATTGSFKQRAFHRLVIMGEATAICGKSLAGTITGSPQ